MITQHEPQRTERTPIPQGLACWVAEAFPDHPHVYWGRSGAALLFHALRQERRTHLVLPAFICPELPAMALAAGLKVALVDVCPETLHMGRAELERALANGPDSETALLVDHTFGYPDAGLPEVRRAHPDLLLVEDCARALGARINGQPVGRFGDWTLLSLYKTTPGNNHGAVLLTRSPYDLPTGPAPETTWRQWASTSRSLRLLYDLFRRRRAVVSATRRKVDLPTWEPQVGLPNRFCLKRFARSVVDLEAEIRHRRAAAGEIRSALDGIPGLRFIQVDPGCEPASYFFSFTLEPGRDRNRVLGALYRRGLFLLRTWDSIPAFATNFHGAFPSGATGSVFLADHVLHVPVVRFTAAWPRNRLAASMRELLTAS